MGNLNGGHYFSYIKGENNNWRKYDDASINDISENQLISNNTYILIYKLKSDLNNSDYMNIINNTNNESISNINNNTKNNFINIINNEDKNINISTNNNIGNKIIPLLTKVQENQNDKSLNKSNLFNSYKNSKVKNNNINLNQNSNSQINGNNSNGICILTKDNKDKNPVKLLSSIK